MNRATIVSLSLASASMLTTMLALIAALGLAAPLFAGDLVTSEESSAAGRAWGDEAPQQHGPDRMLVAHNTSAPSISSGLLTLAATPSLIKAPLRMSGKPVAACTFYSSRVYLSVQTTALRDRL